MELFFLALLFFLMIWALTSGFPVAYALPGSAIISIGLAALAGYVFAGDPSAYFAQDGPVQWLNAGVTNFRSLYWIVERDTLIAIPLFIFMGIMLQRSKIAEDLLVAMAQLFGPLPGGLGISVVFVGALLAATTGIVGATVIAMGLISLPAMLRNNYSKSLASGTICASGTLGQIIPPSIVLIILADQLSNAADQANTMRKAMYTEATGEFSMPSSFEVVSASAGDMFMGAFIPGMILVGLYMLYILITAWLKPEMAPPVPYDGAYDRKFALRILLALVPPLSLIFIVLGSIILGVATVNQAGAIGAMGAMIMAGYRLHTGSKTTQYIPAVMAMAAIVLIAFMINNYDLNVKNIKSAGQFHAILVTVAIVTMLLVAIGWSAIRVLRIDDTLKDVMTDTSKMTTMVFIILIGAAMLTSAFRGFGGEELVKEFLTTLPGGFWTQFIVVMLVIFLLGFFLDFIEIAVVVVPIVAPILLANPEANVTAVWFGVMVGLNIQTSFLTPPFGFALFYLRGVADKIVKTTDIYKGAVAFILLQIVGLIIVGFLPGLVNYLPNRTHLLSDTAPPPLSPKLQLCMEDYIAGRYEEKAPQILAGIETMQKFDVSYLPDNLKTRLDESVADTSRGLDLFEEVLQQKASLEAFSIDYQPLQSSMRVTRTKLTRLTTQIEEAEEELDDLASEEGTDDRAISALRSHIEKLTTTHNEVEASIPDDWEASETQYKSLSKALTKVRREYYNAVDSSYESIAELREIIGAAADLKSLGGDLDLIQTAVSLSDREAGREALKQLENKFSDVKGASGIKSKLSKARRVLKKDKSDEAEDKLLGFLQQAKEAFVQDLSWRQQAQKKLLPGLNTYDALLQDTVGLRLQERLTKPQAKSVARCLSRHKNISLDF